MSISALAAFQRKRKETCSEAIEEAEGMTRSTSGFLSPLAAQSWTQNKNPRNHKPLGRFPSLSPREYGSVFISELSHLSLKMESLSCGPWHGLESGTVSFLYQLQPTVPLEYLPLALFCPAVDFWMRKKVQMHSQAKGNEEQRGQNVLWR